MSALLEALLPYGHILASVGMVALSWLVAAKLVPNPQSRKQFHPASGDVAALVVGFAAMVTSAVVGDGPASVWSWVIDLGSFAIGTSLIVTSAPGLWPRMVGAFIVGIHLAQVVVTNDSAPLVGVLATLKGA